MIDLRHRQRTPRGDVMIYRRQGDTFIKMGEVASRYVTVRSLIDGVWTEPLCPIRRTHMVRIIEAAIDNGCKNLKAQEYELTGVASLMTEEEKERLAKLRKSRKDVQIQEEEETEK